MARSDIFSQTPGFIWLIWDRWRTLYPISLSGSAVWMVRSRVDVHTDSGRSGTLDPPCSIIALRSCSRCLRSASVIFLAYASPSSESPPSALKESSSVAGPARTKKVVRSLMWRFVR